MEVTESLRQDGISILKLAGRMDIEGTGKVELKLTVATAVDRAHVIADLSDVTFMSSIGIGVLVRLAKTIRRRDGNLVLLNPQPIVRLVLEKTGIPGVIGLYDTMDAALAGVRTERH
jgi:stage II sporulation protein AA (anti-sigma F factor antagonist)